MNMPEIFWLIPVSSIIALSFAYYFFKQMMKYDEGTKLMKEIASYVRNGAITYLKQQYKVVAIAFVILSGIFAFLAYGLKIQNPFVPFAFITGGFFSGLAGFLGMKTATYASARTANAARRCLNEALVIAFRSGGVMGLVVVGLGLFDISFWFFFLNLIYPFAETINGINLIIITTTALTFGMGASTQALFARVGGGIFTKCADVGADKVGKIEAGIPEDDPRNPATITDNVGDNVGDVAGMGADLYESYCGAILSTAALGATGFIKFGVDTQFNAVIAPMLIASVGILLSIFGIFLVKTKEGASQKQLLHSLQFGVNFAAVGIAIFSWSILYFLKLPNYNGIWLSALSGLIAGILMGQATEYYTSASYRPTRKIAAASETGHSSVITSGMAIGMISTAMPVLIVGATIMISFGFSTNWNFQNFSMGLYGIAIAATTMLSTLGFTLATDAYGPIADNAGGNAEMSGLEKEVRERTDALDSLGNTTAATGKGFAVGSAALTALALLAAFFEEARLAMVHFHPDHPLTEQLRNGTLMDMLKVFDITIMNPRLITGAFIGVMLPFLFSGLTMDAVNRSSDKIVAEVRRQFKIKGILTGEIKPDYTQCVKIATKAAQNEMIFPSFLAICATIIVGMLLGIPGMTGLLIGSTLTGFTLAVFLNNVGGSWDNGKKHVEAGNHGGKGSECHKAAITGDTVGDPCKDTCGPSLNILIKLMAMVAIVTAGVIVSMDLNLYH